MPTQSPSEHPLPDAEKPTPPAGPETAPLPPCGLTTEGPTQLLSEGVEGCLAVPEHVAVPGYELLRELGRGGMGLVYLARHVRLNLLVALKMIRTGQDADPQEVARFNVEAQAVAALHHPNVVRIYDYGMHNDLPYFSMELVRGGSLAAKVRGGPLPARQAAQLAETLARTAHVFHQRGIVHRDLKPGNILLTEDGEPKITDFGLAKRLNEDLGLTATGAAMGTAGYMAPEQARGENRLIGPTTDVYALGAILYEALTGRPPFRAATRDLTINQILYSEATPPSHLRPDVPTELEAICLKCLAKDPGQRYATALLLAEDLYHFLAGEPISIATTGEMDWHTRWARQAGYDILELMMCGRSGFVYKARQTSLNRLVTLKLISSYAQPDATALARFRREAQAIARLHHPNIVQIYDFGEEESRAYFVMEFVEGDNLAEKYPDTPLPAHQAAKLMETLAGAVHYAHEQGIIHCSLRPSSVLVTTQAVPKITRFGMARLLNEEPAQGERDGRIVRSPTYLAPEQLEGHTQKIGPQTDVYALGAILYKLLTGEAPFVVETLQVGREQVLTQDPLPPSRLQPDIPVDLAAICLKCLQKEPERRYATALEMADDLRRFLTAPTAEGPGIR